MDNFLKPISCIFSDKCSYYRKKCSNCIRNRSINLSDNYKAKTYNYAYNYTIEPPKCKWCGNLNIIRGYKCNNCGEVVE